MSCIIRVVTCEAVTLWISKIPITGSGGLLLICCTSLSWDELEKRQQPRADRSDGRKRSRRRHSERTDRAHDQWLLRVRGTVDVQAADLLYVRRLPVCKANRKMELGASATVHCRPSTRSIGAGRSTRQGVHLFQIGQ